MKLRASSESGTCTVDGVTYPIEGGIVSVDNGEHAKHLIESHGFRKWLPPAQADDDDRSDDDDSKSDDQVFFENIPTMARGLIMRTLKRLGVSYPSNTNNEGLRKILTEQWQDYMQAKLEGKEVPQISEVAEVANAKGEAAVAERKVNEQKGFGLFTDAELDAQRAANGGKTDSEVLAG